MTATLATAADTAETAETATFAVSDPDGRVTTCDASRLLDLVQLADDVRRHGDDRDERALARCLAGTVTLAGNYFPFADFVTVLEGVDWPQRHEFAEDLAAMLADKGWRFALGRVLATEAAVYPESRFWLVLEHAVFAFREAQFCTSPFAAIRYAIHPWMADWYEATAEEREDCVLITDPWYEPRLASWEHEAAAQLLNRICDDFPHLSHRDGANEDSARLDAAMKLWEAR